MALIVGGVAVDATAAEIDVLDGLDRGSIIYGNASSATTVLGQGGADEVLTSDGTDIAWAAAGGANFDTAITINDSGNDADFRVEGVGEANALFVQGSDGNVGIGTSSPAKTLDVSGDLRLGSAGGSPVVSSVHSIFFQLDTDNDSTSQAFEIRNDGSAYNDGTLLMRVQENGKVGINGSPSSTLDVFGDFQMGTNSQFSEISKGTTVDLAGSGNQTAANIGATEDGNWLLFIHEGDHNGNLMAYYASCQNGSSRNSYNLGSVDCTPNWSGNEIRFQNTNAHPRDVMHVLYKVNNTN